MAEPRRAGPDLRVVGDGADAQENVVRQRLPGGDDGVIAEERAGAKLDRRESDHALMDARPAEIDAVSEESLRPDLDEFGDGIDDGADLATFVDPHAGKAQPD